MDGQNSTSATLATSLPLPSLSPLLPLLSLPLLTPLTTLLLLLTRFFSLLSQIPGSQIIIRYIEASHQNDPGRTVIELAVVGWGIWVWRKRRTRRDEGKGGWRGGAKGGRVELDNEEIDDLISRFHPAPLVSPNPTSIQLSTSRSRSQSKPLSHSHSRATSSTSTSTITVPPLSHPSLVHLFPPLPKEWYADQDPLFVGSADANGSGTIDQGLKPILVSGLSSKPWYIFPRKSVYKALPVTIGTTNEEESNFSFGSGDGKNKNKNKKDGKDKEEGEVERDILMTEKPVQVYNLASANFGDFPNIPTTFNLNNRTESSSSSSSSPPSKDRNQNQNGEENKSLVTTSSPSNASSSPSSTPSFPFLSHVKLLTLSSLRRYGVGSCSPSGFYGTFDLHLELEYHLSQFLSVQSSIIYAQDFMTISSVIPSFAKRGDLIIVDKGVRFAIKKGVQISRSRVRWFGHGGEKDGYNGKGDSLEEVLEEVEREEQARKRRRSRRGVIGGLIGGKMPEVRKFIVTEGVFENDGTACDLRKIMELKKKYRYRLILDETWSFGIVGKTGRGITELQGVPASDVDILTGSLTTSLASSGGFCAGNLDVTTHQRINSPSYVYSAALPPVLALGASEAIKMLMNSDAPTPNKNDDKDTTTGRDETSTAKALARHTRPPHPLGDLQQKVSILRKVLDPLESEDRLIRIPSDEKSPLIHISLHPQAVDRLFLLASLPPPMSIGSTNNDNEVETTRGPRGEIRIERVPPPGRRNLQSALLSRVVSLCLAPPPPSSSSGSDSVRPLPVLLTQTSRQWDHDSHMGGNQIEWEPSLRVCVSNGLSFGEIEWIGKRIGTVLKEVVGAGILES